MEPTPTDVVAAWPRSVRWFAPWTWQPGRWRLPAVVIGFLIAYLLSPGAVRYLLERSRLVEIPVAAGLVHVAMEPPIWLGRQCPPLQSIQAEGWLVLRDLFGSPVLRRREPLPAPPQAGQ